MESGNNAERIMSLSLQKEVCARWLVDFDARIREMAGLGCAGLTAGQGYRVHPVAHTNHRSNTPLLLFLSLVQCASSGSWEDG